MDESSVRGVIYDILAEESGESANRITDHTRIVADLRIGYVPKPSRANMPQINNIKRRLERGLGVTICEQKFLDHFGEKVTRISVGDLVRYLAGLPQVARSNPQSTN